MLGMQRKLFVAFLAALCAFFGAVAVAQAAPKSMLPTNPTAGPAAPGTYAARYGAPMCDDRGASSYAAEPNAPDVDAGTLDAPTDAEGHALQPCRSMTTSVRPGAPVPADDVRASTPVVRDLALVPSTFVLPPAAALVTAFERASIDGARDGFPQGDNPPPRPIPWRV